MAAKFSIESTDTVNRDPQVVVVDDEGLDLGFEVSGQVIVFQQDAVFQGLVPTLDLALGLRMVGSASDRRCQTKNLEIF